MRWLSLLLLTGCDVIDKLGLGAGPCNTVDYGYDTPSMDAEAALEQTNCYRNLMGLSRGRLHSRLDDAAQAHAVLRRRQQREAPPLRRRHVPAPAPEQRVEPAPAAAAAHRRRALLLYRG